MTTQGTPPPPANGSTTLASRGIQPRFSELGQSCRKLVLNHLAASLDRIFTQVDDTLFQCAEKAENNQVQAMFFDSMRSVRRLRPQIERQYHQQLSQGIADFLDGKLCATKAAPAARAEDLAVLGNEEYEETLQVTNMVSRIKARCPQSLYALEQRLALLNNGQPLGGSNPFAPEAIAGAFRKALAPSELPLRIKLVLYSLFDRNVMHELEKVYEALNLRLIDAGVLPNLKYSAARSADSTPDTRATEPLIEEEPNERAASHVQGDADEPSVDLGKLLSGLSALLDEYRQHQSSSGLYGGTPSMASFAPSEARYTYDAAQLIAALNRMQQASANDIVQRLEQPQQVASLKADLQRQLASHCDDPQQHRLANGETEVIDLVGMLFDFILDDDGLPAPYQVALSHLHTPYLKIALLDKALFTRQQHPARKLINAMARAGVLYGAEDETHGLLTKVRWVIEQVIQRFTGDLQLFDSLLNEFNEFVSTLKQRVDLQERRAVESAKGRDKLLSARYSAAQVIARSLAKRSLPPIIRHFLERSWIDVLVFIQLRHGDGSPEFQRASEAAEQLAWSTTVLDVAQRERLQQIRVALLGELRKGLLLLGGLNDEDIRRTLQDIVACQHAVQARQPQLAEGLRLPAKTSPLGAMLGDDAALLSPSGDEAPLSANGQRLLEELEQIEFGTWFEFQEGDTTKTLKLSWYSPMTHNYMFVDHAGQRTAIKSIGQLAREMEQGTARRSAPDRASPVVDRALTTVYRVLQQLTGRIH